jgi:hypothetical protein
MGVNSFEKKEVTPHRLFIEPKPGQSQTSESDHTGEKNDQKSL